MKYLFVRELCGLLHQLRITQDAIADHLSVARSTVGVWASGQRPVPHRHAETFLAFVRSQLHAASERATQDTQQARPRALLVPTDAERWAMQVKDQLRRWEVEIYKSTGRLDADYARHAHALLPYLHLPLSKLSPEERECIRVASNGLARCARAIAHLENRPEGTEGRILSGPFDQDPLTYFESLVRWWYAMQQDDASDECEEIP